MVGVTMAQAPANDNCAGAISLTVNPGGTCTTTTAGTTVSATQTLVGCTGTADDDVWYQFVASYTSQTITVTPGTLKNPVMENFSGTCSSLTSLGCVNASSGASTAETTTLTGLTVGATYYVRVYSSSSGSSNKGTFTMCVTSPTAPSCTSNTSPANAATGIALSATLTWTAAATATSYDVYYGTTSPPTTLLGNYTTTTATLSGLTGSTRYYWYVVPKNSMGAATGCSSSSTYFNTLTPPACTSNTSPANAATNIALSTTLTWAAASTATSYDVYYGTSSPPTTLLGNYTTTSATLSGLVGGTRYYWYVVPKNAAGDATGCSSANTYFNTKVPPSCVTNSSPTDGATNTSLTPTITWPSSSGATSYDVYFGTTNPPTALLGNYTTRSVTLTALPQGTVYYWYVVPKSSAGPAVGCSSNTTRFTTLIIPANDSCDGAITLTVNPTSTMTTTTSFVTTNASQSLTGYGYC